MLPILRSWLDTREENREPSAAGEPISICEFGGGAGFLLAEFQKILGGEAKLFNVELVDRYRDHQSLEEIEFINSSVLKSELEENSFDVVVLRQLLHHLVGYQFSDTRRNQRKAIEELVRVAKPGGIVLIQEQVIPSMLSCRLVYRLSTWASKLRLNIPYFEMAPDTVVAYLHPEELVALARDVHPAGDFKVQDYVPRPRSLRWKLTWLLRKTETCISPCRSRAADCNPQRFEYTLKSTWARCTISKKSFWSHQRLSETPPARS